ncbi:hypothetical protein Scep_001451 [Stephania cephalantha]|uniref:Uncharacterized protein n=1 Tax=Stephania cephalantha TaxID=152367 RepID=A0AAP0LAT5_9MAGN
MRRHVSSSLSPIVSTCCCFNQLMPAMSARTSSIVQSAPDTCNSIMASYAYNYDRFEDSYYHGVNGVRMSHNGLQFSNSESFVQQVVVCENCGECFHPTYACPHYPNYRNHHGSSYALPQPNFYMSRRSPQIPQHEKRSIRDMMNDLIFRELPFQQSDQHEQRIIADIERDMIFDWLSQSTTQQPLQEDMQHMNPKLQNLETQVHKTI